MAFLEWRKFAFYDLKINVDEGQLSSFLQDVQVECVTSGCSQAVFGDKGGMVHLVSKWTCTSFRAFETCTYLVWHMKNLPLLIAVGNDTVNVNPVLKVWDMSRIEKANTPFCYRYSRINKTVAPTCICVHENATLMVLGFTDGSLFIYRGDIKRERSSKIKYLRRGTTPISGLAFKATPLGTFLFVASQDSVFGYNIHAKDKESFVPLDEMGCNNRCTAIAESLEDSHFVMGRNDAIYCYTIDGRGPCYAIEGEKIMVMWFRTYLVIVSKPISPSTLTTTLDRSPLHQQQLTSVNSSSTPHLLTILDIQNKFIVFSSYMPEVRALWSEWGGLYALDVANQAYHLDEKDVQSKLELLFKKNLYDVAIKIAKSTDQYDPDSLAHICRQYGDHLCDKGDYAAAVDQYIKTIGRLETSYVIRKFLDVQHIEHLTKYLEAVHKTDTATPDHTTLLLNCYTKLSHGENNTDDTVAGGQMRTRDRLKEFVQMSKADLKYDVDVAIKVCRQNNPKEALLLAQKHNKHDWYIKLLMEDHQMCAAVLDYVGRLSFNCAESLMLKYGRHLIEKEPRRCTELLKRLCTNFVETPPQTTVQLTDGSADDLETAVVASDACEQQRSDPELFLPLFVNKSAYLVDFVGHLIAYEDASMEISTHLYNTFLHHYLVLWHTSASNEELQQANEAKILKFLQNTDCGYNQNHILLLCHHYGFQAGILYFYEQQKLYQQILHIHLMRNDLKSMLMCCQRYGNQEPKLWLQTLWHCVDVLHTSPDNVGVLCEVLKAVCKERLMATPLVIDVIMKSTTLKLADIKDYLVSELERELLPSESISELVDKYQQDMEVLREQVRNLREDAVVIQGARCAACTYPLDLPTVHFLCSHSFHQHCFQQFSEDGECITCRPQNESLMQTLAARGCYSSDLHETFHAQLEKATDGFSVAAEYFGRGVFPTFKMSDALNGKFAKLFTSQRVSSGSRPSNLVISKPPKPVIGANTNVAVAAWSGNASSASESISSNLSNYISEETVSNVQSSTSRYRQGQEKMSSEQMANTRPTKLVDTPSWSKPKSNDDRHSDLRAKLHSKNVNLFDSVKKQRSSADEFYAPDLNPFGNDENDGSSSLDYDDEKNPFSEIENTDPITAAQIHRKASNRQTNPFDNPNDSDN